VGSNVDEWRKEEEEEDLIAVQALLTKLFIFAGEFLLALTLLLGPTNVKFLSVHLLLVHFITGSGSFFVLLEINETETLSLIRKFLESLILNRRKRRRKWWRPNL